jgi:hypothetical protein
MKIRETIERDLAHEPQSHVRVYEDAQLRTDFVEYVLTDVLAREFAKVLEPIIESARPATAGTNSVGIWVSGFFGSGKSHFAKIAGHLVADTLIDEDTARGLFARLFKPGHSGHDQLAEVLQEAGSYGLRATLVPFDIATEFAPSDAGNVGRTFLRALYDRIGLSRVIPFAERELELQRAGLHEDFVELFERKTGRVWFDEKDLASSMGDVAACLSELLPDRYPTPEAARENLKFELDFLSSMTIKDVVTRLVRWLDGVQAENGGPHRVVFVADEVGAWTGRDLKRIEQVRGFVEELGVLAQGRIWLLATSQERLSEVVSNAPSMDPGAARELHQRLEARFRINVHLESSEVSTVIEERILEKKPTARPALEALWQRHEAQLAGIAASPGVEMGGNYPSPDLQNFVRDYPFLPYQISAAADLFGAMRGPKVSSGARSMIKVVFDAVKEIAGADLGRVVSWDQIFDSANSDNEFADEQYLGSQGLSYLTSADQHVEDTPMRPSRVLKVLWLTQQSPRIPRTVGNLARLLVDELDADVLQIERQLGDTLAALEKRSYVRQEPATDQWRFLTQDQVTVERIVQRIAEEDVKANDLREATFRLYSERLAGMFSGRITHGKSSTVFDYGAFYGDTALKNEDAPVQLRLCLEGTPVAAAAKEQSAADLTAPVVYWVVPVPEKLEERLRRATAIDRLPTDEELRRVATERTWKEVEALKGEADDLRTDAGRDVQRALEGGTLYFAGQGVQLDGAARRRGRAAALTSARTEIEKALRDRIEAKYTRFGEGDLDFNSSNVEKVLTIAPQDRAGLDPALGFFDENGHALPDKPVLEAIVKHLTSSTKNSGKDLVERFRKPPFGWPPDIIRYAVTSLFVEGRLSAREPSGKVVDDPRRPAARALFGTAAFRSVRFEVEENPLTPKERSDARALLTELGAPPTDDGEFALKEGVLQLTGHLVQRNQAVLKAREAKIPLPAVFEMVDLIRDELLGEGSRAKVVRTLLARAADLRELDAALDRLESFVKHNGPAQYRRAKELLAAAMDAGLSDDSEHGAAVRSAQQQWEAVEEQRRVIEEWAGPLADHRTKLIEVYRNVYGPLREKLAGQVTDSRLAITSMREYEELSLTNRAEVRSRFLADGQPLAEVSTPAVRDEEQLVLATRQLSIPHIRARLAALGREISLAKTLILERYAKQLEEQEEAPRLVIWDPLPAFSGVQLSTEGEVDMVFDAAKDEVKAIVREGKIVRIL